MINTKVYPMSLNSDTFNAMKTDFDQMLRKLLSGMEKFECEEGTLNIKVGVKLEKDQARDFEVQEYEAMRDIVKPTFKHEISSAMQVKDKKSGSLGGNYELVWDRESGQYVMRNIDDGQTTLFDQEGGHGDVVDAEYTVADGYGTAEDSSALPAGAVALPSPEEVPEEDSMNPEEIEEAWDTFHWLQNLAGTPMKVLEAWGNYTVRTEANKIVLTSVNPHTTLYCPAEILRPHVGHRLVCVATGPADGEADTISIMCEECEETLFVFHSPAWPDNEAEEPADDATDSEAPEDYPYEEPGEEV